MDITEKRKLLYYIVERTKRRRPNGEWENGMIVNVLNLPAIEIKVKEHRPFGTAWDLYIMYLGKQHQIDIRAKGFDYDIFERTDNNFWDVFDDVMIKMLIG